MDKNNMARRIWSLAVTQSEIFHACHDVLVTRVVWFGYEIYTGQDFDIIYGFSVAHICFKALKCLILNICKLNSLNLKFD